MDPLSLTAGIIAVVGATGTVGKTLKKLVGLRHAPKLLRNLNDRVSYLHLLIESISDVARELEEHDLNTFRAATVRGLRRIEDDVLELEKLIVYDLTTIVDSGGDARISRVSWMNSQSRIEQLESRIHDDTSSVIVSLQLVNM